MMQSILIIEDIPAVMKWVEQSARLSYPDAEIFKAINLSEAMNQVTERDFDMALVDIGLPDGSGMDVVDYLVKNQKETLIVMTTIFDDDQNVFNALRKGAKGYILKDQDKDQLAQLLLNIEKGQLPISPQIANKLLGFFNPKPQENQLTQREQDVLTLIAKGINVPKVAELLEIKSSTCYGYVKDIYQKLNINSRAEATLQATRMGLVNFESE